MSRATRRLKRSFRRARRLGDTSYDITGRNLGSKFLKQLVISLVLLGLILAIQEFPAGMARSAEGVVRWVVTEDTDLVLAMRRLPAVEALARGDKPLLPFLSPLLDRGNEEEVQAMIWPLEGRIVSGFGWRFDPDMERDYFHEGIDIEAPLGTLVKVVLDGNVSEVTDSPTFGQMVVVDHGSGLQTVYAHLSEVLVRSPQPVRQGEPVGRVGQTGTVLSPQLHFEVRQMGVPVDPAGHLGLGEPGP